MSYRLVLTFLTLWLLAGCSSMPPIINDSGLKIAPDAYMVNFQYGKLRLNCKTMGCSYAEGFNGPQLKELNNSSSWWGLVRRTIDIGYPSNRNYFFLGKAAEKLGFLEAALIYYELSMNVSWGLRCGPSFTCEGVNFPEDPSARMGPVLQKIESQKVEDQKLERQKKLNEVRKTEEPQRKTNAGNNSPIATEKRVVPLIE